MLIPCGHRVLVEHDKLEEKDEVYKSATQFGIVIPENSKEKRLTQNAVDTGIIISIGETAWKDFGDKPWAKVGDYIAFARHAGKYIEDPADKKEYVILNDEDIVCVIKGDK